MSEAARGGARAGVLAAVAAYLVWGLSPLYWKVLREIAAPQLLAHRVLWSFVLLAAWVSVRRRWRRIRAVFEGPATARALMATTVLIAVNWLVFIWAVNSDRVLEASLGYYINPLVSVALGMVVLGERLNRRQALAVALAGAGVVVLTLRHGSLPWVSLTLAGCFGLYGLVRKVVRADEVTGLTFETMFLAPVALGYLVMLDVKGAGALGHSSAVVDGMLLGAGVLTTVPLLLFTMGARRLRLATVGLLQFVTPTCHFLLATLVFGEPFTWAHGVAFGLIWIALAVYGLDLARQSRVARRVVVASG